MPSAAGATAPAAVAAQDPAAVQAMVAQPMAVQGATGGVATLGEVPKPPSTIGTLIKSVLGFAAGGAALGAGASLLAGVLPFTLPFTLPALPIMAAIGGAAGAVVGLVRGIRKAKSDSAAYDQALAAAQMQSAQTAPPVDPAAVPQATADASMGDDSGGEEPAAPAVRRYTIRKGDTLSAIGRRTGVDWHEIYRANKGKIGSNPNLIHPGTVLTIPAA
jgi:nucleoid-associated protein YgaU